MAWTKVKKLDAHHRATVEKIFRHPASHNIEWHDIVSLLRSVAEVTEGRDGRYTVTMGSETETLNPPRGNDMTSSSWSTYAGC